MLACAALLSLAACTKSGDQPAAENPALTAPVPPGMVRGTVLETMDAAGYTYMLLDTPEGQNWFAAQQSPVSVGDVVQTDFGLPMRDFTSNSVGRTFDVIYFSSVLQNLSTGAMPESQPQTAIPADHPKTPIDDIGDVTVEAFEEGKDIAWVHANKDSLAGQSVTVRGTVVKYNPDILELNFLHIRDGSGNPADGSNDLLVTTQASAAVGQTVVVSGEIVLDEDFGAGYRYPVLIQEATITLE